MPLIMEDDDQYMEDLFGENEQVSIPAAPVVKGLPQRLDELASTNCCQKIAWSRFGCVAAVSDSGRNVDLYTYVRNPKDGSWNLTKPTQLWPPIGESHQIVHITWSHMGNDLTVVDSSGHILIYSTGFALGQMMLVRPAVNEQDGEMNSLVGLHWLPVFPHTQKSGIYWSATRSEEDWKFRMSHHLSPGPYNPVEGKSALVCLTRSGVLRLLYQHRDGRWFETTADLEDSASTIDYSFTHASFAPDADNSLLLAAHQVYGALRLYKININWPQSVDQKDGQQRQPPASPSLEVTALLEEESCFPLTSPIGDQDDPNNSNIDSSLSYQLSYLELVPIAPEQGTREPTQPTIMAVFAVSPSPSAVLLDSLHQYQQASSVICRWELRKGLLDKLSPCFDQLTVKKKQSAAVAARQRARLKRLPDISLNHAALSVLSLRNSTMFAFTMSNGEIQFRYRDTMELVSADEKFDEAHSMPQSGFIFPTIDPCLHTTFSPSACVIATLKSDGIVKAEKMQYTFGSLTEIKDDDPKLGAVTAVLALQHSSACMQYKNTDDLLSILPQSLSDSFTHGLLTKICKFLAATFDFVSDENQKQIPTLYRHHILFKCLSIQSTLGSADKKGNRKLAARLAWITINLRLVSLNISMNLRSNENLRAEMALSFLGLVKWSLDLCIYLLQEIFRLHYLIKHKEHEGVSGMEKDRSWVQDTICSNHSPAVIVLLSSVPRILLRMMFRPLRHGMIHSNNGFKTAISVEHKQAFSKLLNIYQATPIAILPLEQYLVEVDTLVKTAYRKEGLSDAQREVIERDMFLTCTIPPILMSAVTEMLTTKLEPLMELVDPGKIHVHDVMWLGLTDDKRTRTFHEKHTVDVIRKFPLSNAVRLRRCPRCSSVMEDIVMGGPGAIQQQQWVWQSQKTCICFNSWATPEPKGDGLMAVK